MNNKPQPQPRYISKDGEVYTLSMGTKLSADNEQKPVFQLRSDLHYFECDTEAELEKFFVKI